MAIEVCVVKNVRHFSPCRESWVVNFWKENYVTAFLGSPSLWVTVRKAWRNCVRSINAPHELALMKFVTMSRNGLRRL